MTVIMSSFDEGPIIMATADNYRHRCSQLQQRCLRETSRHDWGSFVAWLIDRRPALRPASFRQYRAAVTSVLQEQKPPDWRHYVEALHDRAAVDHPDQPRRTSARRARGLADPELLAILDWLGRHHGQWDALASTWLVWAIHTGLRPIEWQTARVEHVDDSVWLVALNAKHDALRAHGAERRIGLHLREQEVQLLQQFIHTLRTQDFSRAYRGCRVAVWRAALALWPRRQLRPGLYSARHQFAADCKSAGLAPQEIAALMGHSVIDTHQEHYGKRRCGRGEIGVHAHAQDVQRVRSGSHSHEPECFDMSNIHKGDQ